jgi:hypothetical protein
MLRLTRLNNRKRSYRFSMNCLDICGDREGGCLDSALSSAAPVNGGGV